MGRYYPQVETNNLVELGGENLDAIYDRVKRCFSTLNSQYKRQELPHIEYSDKLIEKASRYETVNYLYINAKPVAEFVDTFLEENYAFRDWTIELDLYNDLESEVEDDEIEVKIKIPIEDFKEILNIWDDVAERVSQGFPDKVLEKVNLVFTRLK